MCRARPWGGHSPAHSPGSRPGTRSCPRATSVQRGPRGRSGKQAEPCSVGIQVALAADQECRRVGAFWSAQSGNFVQPMQHAHMLSSGGQACYKYFFISMGCCRSVHTCCKRSNCCRACASKEEVRTVQAGTRGSNSQLQISIMRLSGS